MRSFNGDMHWPLLNYHWENSGFGLWRVLIGGALTSGGSD